MTTSSYPTLESAAFREWWQDHPQPERPIQGTLKYHRGFWSDTVGRRLRLWLYLPPSYFTSRGNYRLLVAHDGQQLWDRQWAGFHKAWGADQTLAILAHRGLEFVCVGIENDGSRQRQREYNPNLGDGDRDNPKAHAYITAVVTEVVPFIRAVCRIDPDRGVGMFGASLGALASLAAPFWYPTAIDFVGVFSPPLHSTAWLRTALAGCTPRRTRFFLAHGTQEADWCNVRPYQDALTAAGFLPDREVFAQVWTGDHEEALWGQQLPRALELLAE